MGSKMQLEDWLDDLCVRFIINLPQEDLSSVARICFQVEEAQWFYEDFIRPLDASLPPMSLRQFCLRIFQHCPLLSCFTAEEQMAAFEAFLKYKERVPVRGAIMLNEAMDSAVLVKGWKKGANWSFPRGKINKDEDDLDCAIRELWEETGYDVRAAGLPLDEAHLGEPLDVIMREQHLRFYVFRGVPMDTFFEPKTRKEISKIQWYRLSELPGSRHQRNMQRQHGTSVNVNKFYMVAKFLPMLEKWINKERQRGKHRRNGSQNINALYAEDVHTEEETGPENYFSESGVEVDYRSAPANILSDVSGTEAALKALLRIQPQSQAPQYGSGTSAQQAVSKDKGDALLALLRPAAAQQEMEPHTPMDHSFGNLPVPETPHHHHPRPMQPFSSMGPPPQFPIQSQNSYQPDQHRHPQGGLLHFPNQPQYSQHYQERSQHILPQYENVRRSQPDQLLHPQPLPPQVQKAIFTDGLAHAPMIQQPLHQMPEQSRHQQYQQAPQPPFQPDFSKIHGPVLSNTARQEQPKLTSHTLALLNAFKSRDQASQSGHDEMMNRFKNQNISAPQELSADESPQQPQNIPEMSMAANSSILQGHLENARKPPASEEHKTNLLGLFKSPTVVAAKPAQPPVNTNLLDMFKSSTPVAPAPVKPVNTALLELFNNPTAKLSATNPGPVPTELPQTSRSPQTTSPFRPVAILARPMQGSSTVVHQTGGMRGYEDGFGKSTSGGNNQKISSHLPSKFGESSNVFQPHILKRPEQRVTQTAEFAGTAYTNQLAPTQSLVDRRAAQPADHKQSLLSLFGKSGVAPVSSPPYMQQPTQNQTPERTSIEAASMSRMGSITSTSRRGSQTPVSPADKGFLLGFLNNVAKGDGH